AVWTRGRGRLPKPFGPKPYDMRLGQAGRTLKGYARLAFDDAFTRYLPLKAQQSRQANKTGPEALDAGPPEGQSVAVRKSDASSIDTGPVAVPDEKTPGDGEWEF